VNCSQGGEFESMLHVMDRGRRACGMLLTHYCSLFRALPCRISCLYMCNNKRAKRNEERETERETERHGTERNEMVAQGGGVRKKKNNGHCALIYGHRVASSGMHTDAADN